MTLLLLMMLAALLALLLVFTLKTLEIKPVRVRAARPRYVRRRS